MSNNFVNLVDCFDESGVDLDDFVFLFNQTAFPTWNEDANKWEPTPESEAANPFKHGWHLTPSHPSWRRMSKMDPEHRKECLLNNPATPTHHGCYEVPAACLGFKSGEAPKIHLLNNPEVEKVVFASVKAAQRDPDILTWDQAMAESPDQVQKWLEAASKEVKELESKETWEECLLSDATVKVIPGTWVFRRKRDPRHPDKIAKWKARWVLRGDLQDCDFETFAGVAAWSTVRIFM